MANKSLKSAIGLDIGGTFIKSALVNENGLILKKDLIPTQADKGKDVVIQNIITAISHLKTESDNIAGIGIGVPGNVNRHSGQVYGCFNVPCLEGVELLTELSKNFDQAILVDNDATNATKGEFLFGAGKGQDHLVTLTLGTGIGGGIILNRKVFHGITDYAGEIGHTVLIPEGMCCPCGNRGCFEAYASATAMVNYAKQAKLRDYETALQQVDDKDLNAKIICELANKGDLVSVDIVKMVGKYIAYGVANIITLLNIPLVAIGGGVSEGGDILFHSIDENINKIILPHLRGTFKVVKAQLGNDAGVIGSASTIFMEGNTSY